MSFISNPALGFAVPFLIYFPFFGLFVRAAIILSVVLVFQAEGSIYSGLIAYSLGLLLFLVPVFLGRLAVKSLDLNLRISSVELALACYFGLLVLSGDFLSLFSSTTAIEVVGAVLNFALLALVPFVSALLVFDICFVFLHRLQIEVLPMRLLRVGVGFLFLSVFAVPKLVDILEIL